MNTINENYIKEMMHLLLRWDSYSYQSIQDSIDTILKIHNMNDISQMGKLSYYFVLYTETHNNEKIRNILNSNTQLKDASNLVHDYIKKHTF